MFKKLRKRQEDYKFYKTLGEHKTYISEVTKTRASGISGTVYYACKMNNLLIDDRYKYLVDPENGWGRLFDRNGFYVTEELAKEAIDKYIGKRIELVNRAVVKKEVKRTRYP